MLTKFLVSVIEQTTINMISMNFLDNIVYVNDNTIYHVNNF